MASGLGKHKMLTAAPTEPWSLREKLCLATSVMKSGDQNWVSVSRAIKPFAEPGRPPDWFSQKHCASQYSELLESTEAPKRKRGERGEVVETVEDVIVRRLTAERIDELKRLIRETQEEHRRDRPSGAVSHVGRRWRCNREREKPDAESPSMMPSSVVQIRAGPEQVDGVSEVHRRRKEEMPGEDTPFQAAPGQATQETGADHSSRGVVGAEGTESTPSARHPVPGRRDRRRIGGAV
ncbi:unnamed protein product [Boreogadus saida]